MKIDDSLFEDVEYQEVDDSLFEDIEFQESKDDSLLQELIAPVTGAVAGKGAEKAIEKLASEGTKEFAEEMAYKAIGGENTPEGRKFLKSKREILGQGAEGINPKSIGRRALNEGYADVFKSPSKVYSQIEEAKLKNILEKDELLSKLKGDIDLEDIYKSIDSEVSPGLDEALSGDYDVARQKELSKLKSQMKGTKSPIDIERAKVSLQKQLKFDPSTSQLEAPKKDILRTKAIAYREAVEDLAAKNDPEYYRQLLKNKKATGELGIASDIAYSKSLKEGALPSLSKSDLISSGLIGPGKVGAYKLATQKGSSVLAKATDALNKLSKKVPKKLVKSLPFVGALAGAGLSYEQARAEGYNPAESTGKAAIDTAAELALGLGTLALPETSGPRKNTVEYKMESGEKLNTEDYKKMAKDNPEYLNNLMSNLSKSPKNADRLLQAELEGIVNEEDQQTADQKLFKLQQQPAYRRKLNDEYMKKDSNPILNTISEFEGTTKEASGKDPYDVTLGYGAYDPLDHPVSDMTLDQLDKFQSLMLRHQDNELNSSAVGKYQIVRTTLRDLKEKLGLSGSEKFTPELQDKLALELLGPVDGKSPQEIQDKASRIWASVPTVSSGRSHYGQRTGGSSEEFQEAVNEVLKNTERVTRLRGSGDDEPLAQQEDLLGSINNLGLEDNVKEEIENAAMNANTSQDLENLKDMMKKLGSY